MEGEDVPMDFVFEIRLLIQAMKTLGVNFDDPLPAPIKPGGPFSDSSGN